MPVYAGVTFDVVDERDDGFHPRFRAQKYTSSQHYPDSNADERQFGGKGNPTLDCTILVYASADVTALENAWGSTKRALTNLWAAGDNYANVMLTEFDCVDEHTTGPTSAGVTTGWWRCHAVFEYEGS